MHIASLDSFETLPARLQVVIGQAQINQAKAHLKEGHWTATKQVPGGIHSTFRL